MGLVYATHSPSAHDDNLLRLLLSTFRDGSGIEREPDNSTRANWRQMERCVAELLDSIGGEDKQIFDVIALDKADPTTAYGFSIKSKVLSKKDFDRLSDGARVYMEIANSPAKFWSAIKSSHGLTENDFTHMRHPQEVGNTVIDLVSTWHSQGKDDFEVSQHGKRLDLTNSRYLCISLSNELPSARRYQVHAFSLNYPPTLTWRYKSPRCLSAYEPSDPDRPLLDWYGLSGGQLKYYPRAVDAVYHSSVLTLVEPSRKFSIQDKARQLFPDHF